MHKTEQQLKKLELELKTEYHLHSDLELDLEDRNTKLDKKGQISFYVM